MFNRQAAFFIDGIKCQKCIDKIESSLASERVVYKINADIPQGQVIINFNREQTSTIRIKNQIHELGFSVKKIELIK